MTAYGCSKMAVETVSDILRLELLRHGVSVSILGASDVCFCHCVGPPSPSGLIHANPNHHPPTEPAFIQSEIHKKYESPEAAVAKERAQANYAHCFFKPQDQQYAMDHRDPPSVTSAAVLHALTSCRPKARYLISHIDGLPLWAFRWLVWGMSDRVRDFFVTVQMLKEPWSKRV